MSSKATSTTFREAECCAHSALITLREAAVCIAGGPVTGLNGLRFRSRLDDTLRHAEELLGEIRHLTAVAGLQEELVDGDMLPMPA
jgi:hypothetical protein